AHKQWSEANTKIAQDNKAKLDEYQAALSDRKLSVDEQMSKIQMIAAKYKDSITADAAAARNFTLVANLIERQNEAMARLQQHQSDMDQKYDAVKRTFEAKYGSWDRYDDTVKKLTAQYQKDNPLQQGANPDQVQQWRKGLQQYIDDNAKAVSDG